MIPLLRLEGLLIAAVAGVIYAGFDQSWFLFFALVLLPDISILAYYKGPRVGAWCYNLAHTYSVPLFLIPIGWIFNMHYLISIALIWIFHIGFDRALGYGLKAPTGFQDTHLGRLKGNKKSRGKMS